MRTPAQKTKPQVAKLASFPAPVSGWIVNENLAVPNARTPDGSRIYGAAMLRNWFPTATGIRMRGGSQRYAIIGAEGAPVRSLFSYINGNNRHFFAANDSGIYDITTVAYSEDQFLVDDDGNFLVDDEGRFIVLSGSNPAEPGISSTDGRWSVVQFATSGGVFLRAVNGADTPLLYDGADWDTAPAITGITDPTALKFVWAYKRRLFFIERDSLDAWYLPVDSIGGAAVKLPLGGVFTRGGSLMLGATWSIETGNGLNEQCVFITTEGEAAVYQGDDPSSADSWTKVGVYRIGKPRGPKAFIHAGGDLVIATDVGFVPLSTAVQRDYAALSPAAISYKIETAWNQIVEDRPTTEWQCEVWPTKQMVLVSFPRSSGDDPIIYVANARTGAWSEFYGWAPTCLGLFGDRLFFGTSEGRVIEAEVTGYDEALTYTATCVPLFDPLKTPASQKNGLQARAVLRANSPVTARLSLQTDYRIRLPAAPSDTSVPAGALWGTAVWGESLWGDEAAKQTFQTWKSAPGQGYSVSVATQITSGSIQVPSAELIQTDLTYELAPTVT